MKIFISLLIELIRNVILSILFGTTTLFCSKGKAVDFKSYVSVVIAIFVFLTLRSIIVVVLNLYRMYKDPEFKTWYLVTGKSYKQYKESKSGIDRKTRMISDEKNQHQTKVSNISYLPDIAYCDGNIIYIQQDKNIIDVETEEIIKSFATDQEIDEYIQEKLNTGEWSSFEINSDNK